MKLRTKIGIGLLLVIGLIVGNFNRPVVAKAESSGGTVNVYLEFTQPTTSDPDYGLILVDAEKIPQNEITKTTRYKDIWTVDSTYKRTMEDDKELLQAQVNYTNGIWRKKAINLVSKFAFGTEEPDKDQYTQLMAFFNDRAF